ncbi:MAG: hypothetical protein Q8Q59_05945 [Luteolibacter sp.]|nr:hypothetical protein [Luteolibacter sp.]
MKPRLAHQVKRPLTRRLASRRIRIVGIEITCNHNRVRRRNPITSCLDMSQQLLNRILTL